MKMLSLEAFCGTLLLLKFSTGSARQATVGEGIYLGMSFGRFGLTAGSMGRQNLRL